MATGWGLAMAMRDMAEVVARANACEQRRQCAWAAAGASSPPLTHHDDTGRCLGRVHEDALEQMLFNAQGAGSR